MAKEPVKEITPIKCTNCKRVSTNIHVKLLNNRGHICSECVELCMYALLNTKYKFDPITK